MTIFVSVLALQLLIVALGVFLGYKRGIGRGLVRLCELLLLGLISLLLGRALSKPIAGLIYTKLLPMLGEDIGSMLSASESLRQLLVGFLGALIVPLLFALIFGFVGLLSQILLKKRAQALVKLILKKEENQETSLSRTLGMTIGAVSAILVALFLFSPAYTALSLAGNLSDDSIALIGSLTGATEESQTAATSTGYALRVSPLKKGIDVVDVLEDARAVSSVAAPLSLGLTVATTPEGERYDAVDEAASLTNAVGAALQAVREENQAAESGTSASPIATLTSAATAALPHIAGQPFAKELVATAASTAGQHIQNGGSIAGISANTGDVMTDIMVEAMAEVFSDTSVENLSDTTMTLFGVDLNKIEEEQKTEKERAKESKKAEKEAAKESKKAEKEAAKESKKAEKESAKADKTSTPETTKTPAEITKEPETSKTPAETSKPAESTGAESTGAESTGAESTGADSTEAESTKTPEEATKEPETTKPTEPDEPDEPDEDPVQEAQMGALQVLAGIDFNNASGIFEDDAQCKRLINAVYIISNNPTFKPMITALGTLGGEILKDYRDILLPHLSDEVVAELHSLLLQKLRDEAVYKPERALVYVVPPVKNAFFELADKGQFNLTDAQAELAAICIVARYFTTDNFLNPNNLTLADFSAYLGY